MVGNGTAAVRDDKFQCRKILEQITLDQLHEGSRVGVDVVRAGVVKIWVAAGRDMDHGRHVKLAQLLIDRVPMRVGQRRAGPVSARRVGVEVNADKPQLIHDALKLGDAVPGRHAGKLRQLADTDEVVRQQRTQAMDQVVADSRPLFAHRFGADVMRHACGTRREDCQVTAAVFLQLELRLHALNQNLVTDVQAGEVGHRGTASRVGQTG